MTWIRGLLVRRSGRLIGPAVGVAVAVALLASLGLFLASSKAAMTERATSSVAIDWQVQAQPGADPATVLAAVSDASGTQEALPVDFANVPQFRARTQGTLQTTGAGVVVSLPPTYRATFPGVVRTLAGSETGVLVAQQTAANLHVTIGDSFSIARPGMHDYTATVAGVVDLPTADSLFQKVGAPVGAQPTAPPDNVVLLPSDEFDATFSKLASSKPALFTHQVHARRSLPLPADPAAAYALETGSARNLEVATSGTALVGDNLGATLDSARKDALYAQTLFLFLGLPGAVIAGLLTAVVTGAGAVRRRKDQSLLRTRGGTSRQVTALATIEAALVGVIGSVAGLGLAFITGALVFGDTSFGTSAGQSAVWIGVALSAGLAIAAVTIVVPVRRELKFATVAAGNKTVDRKSRQPAWARYGFDFMLLIGAFVIFRITSSTNYALVLAPEGVPSISVNYWAFLGPAMLWVGAGLLTWRLMELLLRRGSRPLGKLLSPIAGPLSGTVAASLSRQRRTVAHAVVLLALAISFAASTATFNSTYEQQAEVDALLTNGADVTVSLPPGTTTAPAFTAGLASLAGVESVEPIQHRFAYVGADLQDLYGVNPTTIVNATSLQDAYFAGGTADSLMAKLAAEPQGILVSDETVKDFQLTLGDTLNLKMKRPDSGRSVTVTFRYIGVAKEFPTAPSDSFLVANASYVAQQTGSDVAGAYLLDTGGQDTVKVATEARALAGQAATVTDIGSARTTIGSSLTSVDLAGLTRVELAFALVLTAAAGGLVLWLGLSERRRTFAIATILGARRRHLAGFVVGEGAIVLLGGLFAGAAIGWVLSHLLVAVLSGVFDPPPSSLAVPWLYLGSLASVTVCAVAVATWSTLVAASRAHVSALRET